MTQMNTDNVKNRQEQEALDVIALDSICVNLCKSVDKNAVLTLC